MSTQRYASVCGRAVLGFVLLLVLHAGCQSVPTGELSQFYYEDDGMWCGNYDIGFAGARLATIAALTHLRMPLYQEGPYPRGLFIDTRTPDNFEARIVIMPLDRRPGATRVCVRVGGFGTHRAVCERVLDEIARHLDVGRSVPPAPVVVVRPPGRTPGPTPTITQAPRQPRPSEAFLPPQPVSVEQGSPCPASR